MVFYGSLIAAVTLGAFFSRQELLRAQTYAFTVLGLSELFHAVGMRSAYGLGIFTQSWEKSADACGSPCGDSDAGCGDGDSFFDETPSHGAAAPGRVAGASPVIRHAAVSA